jgi:translation initiation factor IF-3
LCDENGAMVGVFDLVEALDRARGEGLDVVEVDATVTPPVCLLIDYGKYKFRSENNLFPKKWTI